MLAAGALVAILPVAVHDGLQDGGERGDADPGADQDRVLRPEDVAGRGAVRSVDVDLWTEQSEVRGHVGSDTGGQDRLC